MSRNEVSFNWVKKYFDTYERAQRGLFTLYEKGDESGHLCISYLKNARPVFTVTFTRPDALKIVPWLIDNYQHVYQACYLLPKVTIGAPLAGDYRTPSAKEIDVMPTLDEQPVTNEDL